MGPSLSTLDNQGFPSNLDLESHHPKSQHNVEDEQTKSRLPEPKFTNPILNPKPNPSLLQSFLHSIVSTFTTPACGSPIFPEDLVLLPLNEDQSKLIG